MQSPDCSFLTQQLGDKLESNVMIVFYPDEVGAHQQRKQLYRILFNKLFRNKRFVSFFFWLHLLTAVFVFDILVSGIVTSSSDI